MEAFIEESVRSSRPEKGRILYRLYLIGMIVFLLLAIASLALVGAWVNPVAGYAPVVIFAVLAVVCFFAKDRQIVEYDYALTGDTFTVARILNSRSRKVLYSGTVTEWNAFGALHDHDLAQLRQGARVINATLNREADRYSAAIVQNGRKTVLLLEPSEALLTGIAHASRMKFRVGRHG